MDIITIGSIIAVFIIVLALCFALYKMLTGETTFEEAYGDNIKLLANQQQNSDKNKQSKNKRHQKRKQSLKGEQQDSNKSKEVQNNLEKADEKTSEKDTVTTSTNLKESEEIEHVTKVEAQQRHNVMKKKTGKSSNSNVSVKQQVSTDSEVKKIEASEVQKKEDPSKITINEPENNAPLHSYTDMNIIEQPIDKQVVGPEQGQSQKKNFRKSVTIKDLTMAKVIEHLKQMEILESEMLTYLQNFAEENKTKESKLRADAKEAKMEKHEIERKLKQINEELEHKKSENAQLQKENKEQKDRHVLFEQTVRNKLIETLQLKEENKSLQSRIGQCEQIAQQQVAVIQAELIKAKEDRDKSKEYSEKLIAQLRNTEETGRHNFELQTQTVQAEFNKERELRINLEKEYMISCQMVEKLITDTDLLKKQLCDATDIKTGYENQLQALQNDLNREKDFHLRDKHDAANQIAELTRELDKTYTSNNSLMAQLDAYKGKELEFIARNEQLHNEIAQLKATQAHADSKTMLEQGKLKTEINKMKSEIAELRKHEKDQQERNKELREANFKLLDSVKDQQVRNRELREDNYKLLDAVKQFQQQTEKEDTSIVEKLTLENMGYKQTLESLNEQLETVSRIAIEMEQDKDAIIAELKKQIEEGAKFRITQSLDGGITIPQI